MKDYYDSIGDVVDDGDEETKTLAGQVNKNIFKLQDYWNSTDKYSKDVVSKIGVAKDNCSKLQLQLNALIQKISALTEILKEKGEDLNGLTTEQIQDELELLDSHFKPSMKQIGTQINDMNQAVDKLISEQIELSQVQEKKLLEARTKWAHLQHALENRQMALDKQKQALFYTNQDFLTERSLICWPEWGRKVTRESHVPYFLHHISKKSQWDHPAYSQMMDTAARCYDDIRFAAYRTAFKLQHVQKTLALDKVDLKILKCIDHDLFNVSDYELDIDQLLEILKGLYSKIKVQNMETCIDILLSLFMNMFDKSRQGKFQLVQVKLVLLFLSQFKLKTLKPSGKDSANEMQMNYDKTVENKHDELFSECCNLFDLPTKTMGKPELNSLFKIFLSLPAVVGESDTFCPEKASICTDSLLQFIQGEKLSCTELDKYRNWFNTQPQWVTWINVYFNLPKIDGLDHKLGCAICENSIIGFRYRSLKQFKYSICQNCFLVGKDRTKSYKDFYPLVEYTQVEKDTLNTFTKVMKAKLQSKRTLFKQAEKKLGYSPLAAVTQQMIMNYNSNNNCLEKGSSEVRLNKKKPEKYDYLDIKFTESDIQEITHTLSRERELIKMEIGKRKPDTGSGVIKN